MQKEENVVSLDAQYEISKGNTIQDILHTYAEHANRTMNRIPYNKETDPMLLDYVHMNMGICTEIEEFKQALQNSDNVNATEELGDMFWYAINTVNLLKESYLAIGHANELVMTPTFSIECAHLWFRQYADIDDKIGQVNSFCLNKLTEYTADQTDMLKRRLAYNSKYDVAAYNKYVNIASLILFNILVCAYAMCIKITQTTTNVDIESVEQFIANIMLKNIKKLDARYPEKFSEFHALNRNLENERQILES